MLRDMVNRHRAKASRERAIGDHGERIVLNFARAAGPVAMAALQGDERGREALQKYADATLTLLRAWEKVDGSPASLQAHNEAAIAYLEVYRDTFTLAADLSGETQ